MSPRSQRAWTDAIQPDGGGSMTRSVPVDRDALAGYLEEQFGSADTFELTVDEAGRSNDTLFVTWGSRDLVLRKPPSGATSDSAHDVLREYRVMNALQRTAVPVPDTVLACEDDSVLESEFYLMECLEGDVVRDAEPDRLADPSFRTALGTELVDTLASIHTVDSEAVGLSDLGQPEGFTERQVELWYDQVEWALERTERTDELATLSSGHDWLREHCPESHPHAIVHGDYKLDNVMFGPTEPPEIIGVFDWEMSTLGDPLTDLGWFLIHWHDAKDPDPVLPDVNPSFLARDGYPSREELVSRYEAESGIAFDNERFYRALATFKEAAACEVFYARSLEGSDNPFHAQMEEAVPQIVDRLDRIITGDEPL
ncbi:MAG: aminoglycoside phosphotransferase (APT) family kinase protein [Natrialbaceae archaeon]|jgi:aminoglycoside phosphotransferase (APT) family kinase protein